MMTLLRRLSLFLPLFLVILLTDSAVLGVVSVDTFTRADFPADFVFGSGTSAYQVLAFEEMGRVWTRSLTQIWYSHGATGDIACDGYHKYKEDVQLMTDTGLEAYRLSISWSRLIPNGRGPVNPKGREYYNNLINELIGHGNYQLPLRLKMNMEDGLVEKQCNLSTSFTNASYYAHSTEYMMIVTMLPSIQCRKDFVAYADVCFREFGDRVLHWTTFNEANIFTFGGYDEGSTPPRRCSPSCGVNCTKGNSSTEPYIVGHNILLAHASAARLYRKKYKATQHGFVGLNIYAFWFVPYTNAMEDTIATQRANDFYIGWFVNPLVFGDYPDIMKKKAGTRIPAFTKLESKQLKGSYDFLGVNQYITIYIKDKSSNLQMECRDFNADLAAEMICMSVILQPKVNHFLYKILSLCNHLYLLLVLNKFPFPQFPGTPFGLQGVLEYFKQVYGNPPVYIHENGQRSRRNGTLNDTFRVTYLHGYMGSVLNAVRNGSNARGYFTWSFLDVFELLFGYESGLGLYYVDLDDKDLKRYPKLSAHWYSNFLKGGSIGPEEVIQINTKVSTSS
ncbi:hypothetical protein RJ639_047302 [Escallonia herrerae]|uniref:Uncharacterized protein n=1 Tax=Escallonia herrerae TaxID=1293975 RepID=A0AA88W7L4_9ASTE|nr:hypothetical protein RJ639_047302 [Escallonia herrerae]